MKSIKKLRKFFRLEAKRGYDNKAVMGGLANILSSWELEARKDNLPEQVIQAVITRLRDYHRLSSESRKVVLHGVWQRLQNEIKNLPDEQDSSPEEQQSPLPEVDPSDLPAQGADDSAAGRTAADASPPAEPPPSADTSQAVEAAREAVRETSPPPPPPDLDFQAPIESIHGIGPKRSQALERMGVKTVRDLLYLFPRRHDDYSKLKPINSLWYGEEVTVIGTVQNVNTRTVHGGRMKIVEAVISDKSGSIRVTWFNQPWIAQQLSRAKQVVLSGEIDQYLGRLTLNNPDWEPLSEEQLHTNRIVPVYPLTQDLSQKWLRGLMHDLVGQYAAYLEDPLPETLLEQTGLLPLSDAVEEMHFPHSDHTLEKARERLAFNEIFYLQMGVMKQKHQWENRDGRVFASPDDWVAAQLEQLPFQLTAAQSQALDHVRQDLRSGHPMNRLLQGDVGSGKTVIAALASLIIIHGGAQAAVMAPTSILAEQHYRSFSSLLSGPERALQDGDIRLLIGATPEAEKQAIRQQLASGDIKLVIGTHALLQDPVEFQDLQLAVIDEQHRFGVEQRGTLRQKGNNPHLMVMTATPIPRSLALTLYGDLELSIIDELPPGRQPVETHVLYPRETERAYNLVRQQVAKGNQAFMIYPLVEESEKSDEKAAVEEYQRLQREVFPKQRLGLLHGRLHPDEKEAVMDQFRRKELDILVSTSVVEVGLDIPDATVMLIEGADRFGLAQLHQFRGRVGRGDQKSYCILIPGNAEAVENQRLQAMATTTDGFKLAEIDLQQRGPGQFLGTRQSGFSELKVATMSDLAIIEKARSQAAEVFQADPDLKDQDHQKLAQAVDQFWSGENQGDIS